MSAISRAHNLSAAVDGIEHALGAATALATRTGVECPTT